MIGGVVWYLAVGPGDAGDGSTVIEMLHRVHAEPLDEDALRRLQEEGPHEDDRTGDVLEDAEMVALGEGADMDRVVEESAAQPAVGLGVSTDEARRWLLGPEHLTVDLDPGRTRLHHLTLDHTQGPEVVVVWGPAEADRDGERGPTVAVVAGPSIGPGPSLRVAEEVRDLVVSDAVVRQGGDPPR